MRVRCWRWFFVSLLLTLSLPLSGCGMVAEKGIKPAPDWSRGVPVGGSVVGSLGLVAAGLGQAVHLTWPYETGQGMYII